MSLTGLILKWYSKNSRDLPWRRTKDPYLIWLSEVILQQTRVEQGLPYYQAFSERYPTIQQLAAASEDEVLKLWQGLGYYSRARNLLNGASEIVKLYDGNFPEDYDSLLKIKGIGPYTAAAVASFAFDLPYPVIDGNVNRLISRLFAIDQAIDKSAGKKEIETALQMIFDKNHPGTFNQAIMELGSQVCKPISPDCASCPVSNHCIAFEKNIQDSLPVKSTKVKVKTLQLNYAIIRFPVKEKIHTFIQKRSQGFWQNLYEFPLVEGRLTDSDFLSRIRTVIEFQDKPIISGKKQIKHVLSHRKLEIEFYTIDVKSRPIALNSAIFEIDFNELSEKYPTPVPIALFISNLEDYG